MLGTCDGWNWIMLCMEQRVAVSHSKLQCKVWLYETYLFFDRSELRDELQGHLCPEDSAPVSSLFNYTLHFLLVDLIHNAPLLAGFFYSSLANDTHGVYGLAQCRGHLATQNCRDCLNTTMKDLSYACLNRTKVVLRYDNCYLRY